MFQQQGLIIVLGICVVGIAISAGFISKQKDEVAIERYALMDELYELAANAQDFYRSPAGSLGGGGSFAKLFEQENGIKRLTAHPLKRRKGEFYLLDPVDEVSIQIVGVGRVGGKNPSQPIKVMITVWPEHSAMAVLN